MDSVTQLFEKAIVGGLFTDYGISVHWGEKSPWTLGGGRHVATGARLFDVSSLTKAVTYLLFWKYFSEGEFSPNTYFRRFFRMVPFVGDRQLLHFLTYTVQGYGFDFEALRSGEIGSVKHVLLSEGFGEWQKKFSYDNFASTFLGFALEHYVGTGIEEILQTRLALTREQKSSFLFHPVHRQLVSPEYVVPTTTELGMRGLVHDPLSSKHQGEDIVAAGLFSDSQTLAEIFHRILARIYRTTFFWDASENQLTKMGITDYEYALGFDIPYESNFQGIVVERPLIFAGWTGCRIFFCRNPRVTVCITTNRVYCGDTVEHRKAFSKFFWDVICTVLRGGGVK